MEAGEELREALLADHRHHRQPDRRVHRVASADPVPEPEHVGGVDAELRDPLGVRRDRHEVLGHRVLTELVDEPAARGGCVRQRLERRERLRRDDEQRRGRIQVGQRAHQVGRVDVGDETRRDPGVGVVTQRPAHHHRTEIRTADTDVDDRADLLAGRAPPLPGPQPVGELAHPAQNVVHVGDDVLPVDGEVRVRRQAQGGVQHRAVLRRC